MDTAVIPRPKTNPAPCAEVGDDFRPLFTRNFQPPKCSEDTDLDGDV